MRTAVIKKTTAIAISLVLMLSAFSAALPAASAATKKLTLSATSLSLTIGDTVDLNQYYSDNSRGAYLSAVEFINQSASLGVRSNEQHAGLISRPVDNGS